MSKWLVMIVVIISIVAIISGRTYYQNKLSNISTDAQASISNDTNTKQGLEESEAFDDLPEGTEEDSELSFLTKNLPEEMTSLINQKYEANELIKVATFGSRALVDSQDEEVTPWPELLEENLNEVYGQKLFQVETFSYGYNSSTDVILNNEHVEAATNQPDILIIESFNWNDNNSQVHFSTGFDNILMIKEAFKSENPDTIVIIQPSHPIPSNYYPGQVDDFLQLAIERGLTVIDHWEKWPGIDDEELLTYVSDWMPTQAGHELWSDVVASQFYGE
ncbi:hypothetical protein LGQ02_18370 [Bacillus shivajii]|uniref:SGNH/GDSL hydrolase family protein n=1 Tax=Bacillus shivajii TaxID=1983719 RepID=UPI001CF9DFB9|nr:hypothetical protein [Bacillus shivajii]UCZ52726.1 hypothetical protein LGQ02_18370 [Bacillus shivajii]